MNKLHDLLVVGTGGLTLQCLPSLILEKYKSPAFFNDIDKEHNTFNHGQLPTYHSEEFLIICEKFIVCISNPKERERLIEKFNKIEDKFGYRRRLTNLVSKDFPNQIADNEFGLIVLDGCIVEPDVQISSNVLINTRCSIHHGSKLGRFVTLSPNVTILGDCEIGDYSFLAGCFIVKKKQK